MQDDPAIEKRPLAFHEQAHVLRHLFFGFGKFHDRWVGRGESEIDLKLFHCIILARSLELNPKFQGFISRSKKIPLQRHGCHCDTRNTIFYSSVLGVLASCYIICKSRSQCAVCSKMEERYDAMLGPLHHWRDLVRISAWIEFGYSARWRSP